MHIMDLLRETIKAHTNAGTHMSVYIYVLNILAKIERKKKKQQLTTTTKHIANIFMKSWVS